MSKENTATAASLSDIDFTEDMEIDQAVEDEIVEQAELPEVPEVVEEAPELLEAPEFFPKEFREHFQALQNLEGGRDIANSWSKHHTDSNQYITSELKKMSESKHDLETFQQYQQALQPLNQIWASQAIHPAMGVAQMAHYGQMMYTNPQGLIQEIAKNANLDLNQLVEDQPYVDPVIQKQLQSLQQQNQQFQQTIGQFQQGQSEQQNQAIMSEVKAFRDLKDANGQPAHPYIEKVIPMMQTLLKGMPSGGNPQDALKEAYNNAVMLTPDIQAEVQKTQDKAKAEQLHAEAQKASESNTRVGSKSKDAPNVKRNLNNIYDDFLDD